MRTNRKLPGSLYAIDNISRKADGENFTVTITLDPSHEIFRGHFPGNPVLPGACTVEILRELAGVISDKEFIIAEASTIKYLSFINPEITGILSVDLILKENEDGRFSCSASVHSGETSFCSFRGILKTAPADMSNQAIVL